MWDKKRIKFPASIFGLADTINTFRFWLTFFAVIVTRNEYSIQDEVHAVVHGQEFRHQPASWRPADWQSADGRQNIRHQRSEDQQTTDS